VARVQRGVFGGFKQAVKNEHPFGWAETETVRVLKVVGLGCMACLKPVLFFRREESKLYSPCWCGKCPFDLFNFSRNPICLSQQKTVFVSQKKQKNCFYLYIITLKY
jgi:hypothetical protein